MKYLVDSFYLLPQRAYCNKTNAIMPDTLDHVYEHIAMQNENSILFLSSIRGVFSGPRRSTPGIS